MELIRGLYNWSTPSTGCVATIGNFDGVHLGHQAIFRALLEEAQRRNLPSVVISFQPLPIEFFNPDAPAQRLQTLRDRVSCVAECGIGQLLLLRFNQKFAAQSAETFIQHILCEKLQVQHLLVGDDFRFGANRTGDINLLQQAASQGAFDLSDTATITSANSRISSTRIRECLKQGDCAGAASLLGRMHRITGNVVHGQKIGRQLGYPTANISLKRHRPLLRGVFAVKVHSEDGEEFNGVANLGERPTVGGKKLLLEVHILNASPDLYGQRLSVDFHHYIRGEKKFDSLDELKSAIAEDAQTAADYFA